MPPLPLNAFLQNPKYNGIEKTTISECDTGAIEKYYKVA
jgi:hypothetical protein